MSTATLLVEPAQPPLSWEAFCLKGPFCVALDGYVAEGPRVDLGLPAANFNHHEGVSRLETRATCAQVLMAIRQGFFQRFSGPLRVFVSDCDEDVCMSWFLLQQPHLSRNVINPCLNRLVFLEDMLDTTAGTYPFPADLPALEELAWVFAPYQRARMTRQLETRNEALFRGVIEDVGLRILKHITGQGSRQALDTRYERLGEEHGVTFVNEIGAQARLGMFSDGIRAYVSLRARPDGKRTCMVGRTSVFVPFDIPRFLKRCNEEEGLLAAADQWGGGETTGGSPRVAGTVLSDPVLHKLVLDAT